MAETSRPGDKLLRGCSWPKAALRQIGLFIELWAMRQWPSMRNYILIVVLLAGCSGVNVVIPPSEQLVSDAAEGRALWNKSAVNNYRYVFQAGGGLCASPRVLITVRSAQVVSVKYAASGRDCYSGHKYRKGKNALPEYAVRSHTITDLFAQLEECRLDCAVMSAEFHPSYGFPVTFHLEPVLEDGMMMEDASYVGRVSDFELL